MSAEEAAAAAPMETDGAGGDGPASEATPAGGGAAPDAEAQQTQAVPKPEAETGGEAKAAEEKKENDDDGGNNDDEDAAAALAAKEKERLRFEVELEFVQCLANPGYLMHLAQTLVLEDPNFLAYLEYLRYWKEPEYAKFIVYPHCLYMLDLLRDKGFRTRLKEPSVTEMIHSQQFFHWQFNRATAAHDQLPAPEGADPVGDARETQAGEAMDTSA